MTPASSVLKPMNTALVQVAGAIAEYIASPELKDILARLEAARSTTCDLLAGLSQEQADFAPDRGREWSVAQIADHILLTDSLYRNQMRQLLAAARSGKRVRLQISAREINATLAFVPSEIIALMSFPIRMMNRFVPHQVRQALIRMPFLPAVNPKSSEPRKNRQIGEIQKELVSSIGETVDLFCGELPKDLTRSTVEHPLLGRNTVFDLLELITAHEERHHGQMRRVLRDPRFPVRVSAQK